MTEASTPATKELRLRAAQMLADYDAVAPGSLFTEGVVLSVVEGYELQTAVAELRRQRGERVIGYKVGCTSPTIRAQLGIDHCVTGRLYDSEAHASGTSRSRSGYANLAIEGELAVELAREPVEDDFRGDGLPLCVARVLPVIELHNHLMRGDPPSAGELIANNAIHAGFVAGKGVSVKDLHGDPSLSIFIDDRKVDGCEGPSLLQTIGSSLQWLFKFARERGEVLGPGQIILTGSIPGLISIGDNCRIRVDAPPVGSVEVDLIT